MLGIGCPDRHALLRINLVENALTTTRALLPRERVRSSARVIVYPQGMVRRLVKGEARSCEELNRSRPYSVLVGHDVERDVGDQGVPA
jgi:hypothetical protein